FSMDVPPVAPPTRPTHVPERAGLNKLFQQQLVLLMHAHKCMQREEIQAPIVPCSLAHCSTFKDVFIHMTFCTDGRTCAYAHCASSRQLIDRWKTCQLELC
ncbi:hypothetical protein PFISCL1PPCAC_21973, partial [Pristionchus fissidentatus]